MQAIISELELTMNLEHAGWIKSQIEDAINYILFSVEVKAVDSGEETDYLYLHF